MLYPKLKISEKEPLCYLMSLLIPFHSSKLESEEQLIASKMFNNENTIQYNKSYFTKDFMRDHNVTKTLIKLSMFYVFSKSINYLLQFLYVKIY